MISYLCTNLQTSKQKDVCNDKMHEIVHDVASSKKVNIVLFIIVSSVVLILLVITLELFFINEYRCYLLVSEV